MSTRDSQSKQRAHTGNLLAGSFLFLATAGFVLWQNTHLTVLWDLSYILENATRIADGQLPYRDFPFPYAPLTFLVQAAIIKLFGHAIFHHYLYAALTAASATLLTWRILLRLLPASRLPVSLTAFLLTVPLIFLGTGGIFPFPFYDSDCTLFILFCAWLLLRLESRNYPPLAIFSVGILLAVPTFIKQNTGLAFLLSAIFSIAWLAFRKRALAFANRRSAALLLAGAAFGFAAALAIIHFTVGLANYFHWTIQFAASRRLPALDTMLATYQDPALRWSFAVFAAGLILFRLALVIARRASAQGVSSSAAHALRSALPWLAAALLSLPFLWSVAELVLQQDDSDRVEALLHLWPVLLVASLVFALSQLPRAQSNAQLLPLIFLAVIHGAFLSQQLWGSTYALWPLLMVLIASILIALAPRQPGISPTTAPFAIAALVAFVFVVSSTLLIAGGFYALSHERLSYVDLAGDSLVHSTLPALRGLAMRGSYLGDFEELVAYVDREIPPNDAILMLPGEDLFYFTTGRIPQFPVLMLDNTINPYSAIELAQLARVRNVQWLIIKRNLQLQEEPISFRRQLIELLSRDFTHVESLNNYDIYRRNPTPASSAPVPISNAELTLPKPRFTTALSFP
jgi:hypothetical protein